MYNPSEKRQRIRRAGHTTRDLHRARSAHQGEIRAVLTVRTYIHGGAREEENVAARPSPCHCSASTSSANGTACALSASTSRPRAWAQAYQPMKMARPAIPFCATSTGNGQRARLCGGRGKSMARLTLDSVGDWRGRKVVGSAAHVVQLHSLSMALDGLAVAGG